MRTRLYRINTVEGEELFVVLCNVLEPADVVSHLEAHARLHGFTVDTVTLLEQIEGAARFRVFRQDVERYLQ